MLQVLLLIAAVVTTEPERRPAEYDCSPSGAGHISICHLKAKPASDM